MRLGKRTARLAEEHDHAFRRLRSEAAHDVLQVETLQQLHDVVEGAGVVDAEVVELHGMRRPQPGRDLRFALETADQLFPRGALRRFLPNQLHRRGTGEEPVLRQPHFAHAAGSQLRDQAVAADRQSIVQRLFVDLEHRPPGHQDRALEHGVQLPDVAWPCVTFEPPHGLGRDAFYRFAELPGVFAHEVFDENRNVLSPILEGGDGDRAARSRRREPGARPGSKTRSRRTSAD